MGQFCSRRKYHLVEQVATDVVTTSQPSSPSPPPPSSPLVSIASFWRQKSIPENAISQLLETSWSAEELCSILLTHPDESLESFIAENSLDLYSIKFPLEFDYLENTKYGFGSSIWGPEIDRMKIADLCLATIASWIRLSTNSRSVEELIVNQSCALLAIVTRNFLGKKPSRSFPAVADGSVVSLHVSILITTYRFLQLWSYLDMKLSDFFSSSVTTIVTLLVDCVNVEKLGSVLKPVRMIQMPENPNCVHGIFYNFFQSWVENQPNIDSIISAHLLSQNRLKLIPVLTFSKPSIADRIIQDDKNFVQLVLDYIYAPSTALLNLELFEELYQMLPVRDGIGAMDSEWESLMDRADEFESHFGIARILINYFKIEKFNFFDLQKIVIRKELFVFQILVAIGKMSKTPDIGSRSDLWWNELLENLDRCVGNEFDHVVVDYLVNLVLEIEFDPESVLLVDPITIEKVIASIYDRSEIDFSQIVKERFLSSEFDDSIRWVKILSRPLYIRFCRQLIELVELKTAVGDLAISGRVSVGTSSQVAGGFINALSSKINQQLGTGGWSRKRVVELRAQRQFFPVNFFADFDPICVFRKVFEFNPLAFLDTERVQTVCRALRVGEGTHEYAFVLHCACVAYLMVGEVEGGLSIVDRLLFEYEYKEAWRLARQLVTVGVDTVPSKILLKAVELCPIDEIHGLIPMDVGEKLIKGVRSVTLKFNHIEAFPNLADDEEVEKYIACIGGDAIGISYQNARILAIQESLVNMHDDEGALIDGIRLGSIAVS